MANIKLGVYGSSGRMGAFVIRLIENEYADQAQVAARMDSRNGRIEELQSVDVIVDFSLPAGTEALLDWMLQQTGNLPVLVCGTTGLSDEQQDRLAALGRVTKVLYSTNFSAGVAALTAILKYAAPILDSLSYKPAITEVHHRHKLDAPSGTAKSLREAICPADPGSIDVRSVREGEVIGKHDVMFSGADDRIVIGHEASNRSLFARGAIDAALWLCEQDTGCGSYTMDSYFKARFPI